MRAYPGSYDSVSLPFRFIPPPATSTPKQCLTCSDRPRRQAAELQRLAIDDQAFNSGLAAAESAPRTREKAASQIASGGQGGKGRGRSVPGRGGRPDQAPGQSRARSAGARSSSAKPHIQSAIAKVKTSVTKTNVAPKKSTDGANAHKPSEALKQAAASKAEAMRLSPSISGIFGNMEIDSDKEPEVDEVTVEVPPLGKQANVFDYKAFGSDLKNTAVDDLNLILYKLYGNREDFIQRYINLNAPNKRERIMMEIVKLDGSDIANDRESGFSAREVLGREFANSRKTKSVPKRKIAQAQLYNTDQSNVEIPPSPGVVFDSDDEGAPPVGAEQHEGEAAVLRSGIVYLLSVFNFVDSEWIISPVWSDLVKLLCHRKKSCENVFSAHEFLEQLGAVVSANKIADKWPDAAPNNPVSEGQS